MNLRLSKKRAARSAPAFNGEHDRLRDEMDRTFDRFFNDPFGAGFIDPKALRPTGWMPAIDASEGDAGTTIRVEAPGIRGKDRYISVSGGTVTIAAQKEESSEANDKSFFHCERAVGAFWRSIDFTDTVDVDKITADAENGVFTIHVAKKSRAKAKQIAVRPARKVPMGG